MNTRKLIKLAVAIDAAKADHHETLRLVHQAWLELKRISAKTRPAKAARKASQS